MWFKNLLKREPKANTAPLFAESFLRRLERLNFRTAPSLRGAMFGERRSRMLRPALDFSDHRAYTPGDDLRHVDWNAYSRHDELFVKLGETTQSVNIHILLDTSPSMAWSAAALTGAENSVNGQTSKWNSALRLAGAMSYLALSGGERLEISAFNRAPENNFGPTQGKRQAIPMLKFLTKIAPPASTKQDHRAGGLTPGLADYARRHPPGGLLIIISDLLDTVTPTGASAGLEPAEDLAGALHFCPAPRWQVLVLHLLTQLELQPAIDGDYDLQDVETGRSLPFHFDETTLLQYRLRVKSWCKQLQAAAASRGAVYAQVPAEWPLEKAVIPYLRRRGALQ